MTGSEENRVLRIEGLTASVGGIDILHGIDLEIRPGEVHAVMGPNGSGKSTLAHVLMDRHGYEVTGGSVTLDGVDLLSLPTWERARAGLFLAPQHPTEVPGVSLESVVAEAAPSWLNAWRPRATPGCLPRPEYRLVCRPG